MGGLWEAVPGEVRGSPIMKSLVSHRKNFRLYPMCHEMARNGLGVARLRTDEITWESTAVIKWLMKVAHGTEGKWRDLSLFLSCTMPGHNTESSRDRS